MKIKGLKIEKRITPEGVIQKFTYKLEKNIFTSISFDDVLDKKIEKKWNETWRKEFPEDAKKLEDELTFIDIPKEYREDVEKMTEKAIEKFAKVFHIHISGDISKHKLDINKLLKFAEESDKKIKRGNKIAN